MAILPSSLHPAGPVFKTDLHNAYHSLSALLQVYPALGSLLHVASDDSMEWVLEALRVVVGAVPEAAATFEGEICGAIMGVWYRHTNDPVLAPACQDVLCTLIGIPQCQEGVLQRVLPTLR